MKILVFVLLAAMSMPLHAERRRAIAPPARVLSIEFVNVPAAEASVFAAGPDAWLDLNAISHEPGSKAKSVRVRRQFAIRVARSGAVSSGTAAVTATVDAQDRRCLLRIDGRALGSIPVVINARAALGAVSVHTLEIEVPDSAAAGPLAALISWQVTAQ
jgi:hypothetical protein